MAARPQVASDNHARRLHNGDKMSREEFHRAYEQVPDSYRAELVGGIVFEASPLSHSHGTSHVRLSYLFEIYAMHTPGVEVADNITVMLSEDDEVQPIWCFASTRRMADNPIILPMTVSKAHQTWWQKQRTPAERSMCI
jgi:hypothetical protein